MKIKNKLEILKNELTSAPVKIVAVSKYATVDQMIEAYEAGIRDFGENKLQSISQKWPELPEELKKNSIWHFIGHLQTNKANKVVGHFHLIHSVDSIKLAERVSQVAEEKNITQDILLEVNILQEESKYGFSKEDVSKLFLEILNLRHIRVKGLMTMAPYTDDISIQRMCFRGLKELRDQLQHTYNQAIPELSMGMSNDYKVAVEEGSTMIRIGQKLFA